MGNGFRGPEGQGIITCWFASTCTGVKAHPISIPLRKAFQRNGDCMLAWRMNGDALPRDHGFPLRVIIPGFVGTRSVKWNVAVQADTHRMVTKVQGLEGLTNMADKSSTSENVVLASLQGIDGLKTVGDDVSLVGNRYRCHSSLA